MAVKRTDFIIGHGIVKLEYKRGVKINDKSTTLKVVLVQNHKKGFFHIEQKLSAEQITGNSADDQATMKTLTEMALFAINDGQEWQKEWHESQPKDPAQSEMFDEPEGDLNMGFVPED